ncbi:MAG: DUF4321 domain-containing protein [Clostridiales bacterium]|jgi:hypothetical protein|nr:DUF4321 domain-containing protein [Clostridiales bacterium]MCI2160456.1 DUF4321 domain-containing protein [Oscillospiraceae bacterium]MCI1961511.1 DUF4321 domain-containing protein [Clostridiales bacterium]MCI2022080.1 DUF4321 domain-containing protein [Clostridiales bacterium]MCI2025905.1 DUF4321 domain-containing protein [Clostridiales bacterium]
MKKKLLRTILLIVILLLAIVLGKVGGDSALTIPWISFFGAGASFGLEPTVVDLYVLKFTFGLTVNINVLQAILILIGILLYSHIKIRE